ncbi:hypothetical protein D3C87_1810290 [compost metagenome]
MLLEDNVGTQNDPVALEIALLVLAEGVEAFQYADDSDGDIGMLVAAVLEGIGIIARVRRPVIRRSVSSTLRVC